MYQLLERALNVSRSLRADFVTDIESGASEYEKALIADRWLPVEPGKAPTWGQVRPE